MFTFTLQALDWSRYGQPHLFVLFFIWVWLIWFSKAMPALFYRPFHVPIDAPTLTASVIIPVVDEPEALFRKVLTRIVAQQPAQVIVVINGRRNEKLEAVCADFVPNVTYVWVEQAGKRNALRTGLQSATGDICVLVDSDTLWEADTLSELLKPFQADKRVGGVTSHQRILNPGRCWLTRFADWMEDIRSTFAMPAQSVFGHVGCLPGRTIAFRTALLREIVPEFMTERFLGVHIEVSDDRSLTNLALRQGWRTVYQRTSRVLTDAPTDLRTFVRQQYRWSRGSQYNTLRMWGWMARRAPLLCLHFTADIVTPFFLIAVFANIVWRLSTGVAQVMITTGTPLDDLRVQVGLAVIGACVSIGVRHIPHFRRSPRDIALLPVFVVVLTFLMTSVRIWGLMTCAIDGGWGTRPNGYAGTGNPTGSVGSLC